MDIFSVLGLVLRSARSIYPPKKKEVQEVSNFLSQSAACQLKSIFVSMMFKLHELSLILQINLYVCILWATNKELMGYL